MSSFDISIILGNKDRNLPKPINNRPGYDIKYTQTYISRYSSFSGERYNQFFEIERLYDTLSVIRPNETPKQWAIRVRVPLQELDVDKTESYILVREQQLAILEEEVIKLKNRIRKLTSRKYNKSVEIKNSLDIVKMAQLNPNQIQPPAPNELNNLFDTLLDENGHIDDYIRNSHTSAWNQRDILNKIIIVNDSALRLKEIADWENIQSQVHYQQISNLTNQITQLHGQLTIVNNNFDLLNQAHNFQTGQLQTHQADLQDWRRKHAKRKKKHVKQKAKHKKWENKEKDSRQIILNLNQQILALQNNLQNMTAIGDLTGITPLLANVEFYDGQVQPDEWYNKIHAILAIPAITNLNDANKTLIIGLHWIDRRFDEDE
ncbi:9004_t:CDS:2 [Entrophospora sp. SA101]|nr:9004_t:CDS:2 [Entrophospora sp. SA101]